MSHDPLAGGVFGSAGYARLPRRLEEISPGAHNSEKADVFGVADRLKAVQAVLGGRHLGKAIDLGGYTGFFPMSLIDAGMIESATVYDADSDLMRIGGARASRLGIADRIEFVPQAIDLNFVRQLPSVDTVLCLNLIHHAGSTFDIAEVQRVGWERYSEDWLGHLRSKCRVLIFSVGLKRSKPKYWDVPNDERPLRLKRTMERMNWSVLYDANVEDIRRFGVERANGRFTNSAGGARARSYWRRFRNLSRRSIGIRRDKLQDYHLYILE